MIKLLRQVNAMVDTYSSKEEHYRDSVKRFQELVIETEKKVSKIKKIADRRSDRIGDDSPHELSIGEYNTILQLALALLKEAEKVHKVSLDVSYDESERTRKAIRANVKKTLEPLGDFFVSTERETTFTDYLHNPYTATEVERRDVGSLRIHESFFELLKLIEKIKEKGSSDSDVIKQARLLQNSPLFKNEPLFSDFFESTMSEHGIRKEDLSEVDETEFPDASLKSEEVRVLSDIIRDHLKNNNNTSEFSPEQARCLQEWRKTFRLRRPRSGERPVVPERVKNILNTYVSESRKSGGVSRDDVSDDMAESLLLVLQLEKNKPRSRIETERLNELIAILESVLWVGNDPTFRAWEAAVIDNKILYLEGHDPTTNSATIYEIPYPTFIENLQAKATRNIPLTESDEKGLVQADIYFRKNQVYVANGIVYEDRVFSEKLKTAKIRRIRTELNRISGLLSLAQAKKIDELRSGGVSTSSEYEGLNPTQLYHKILEKKKTIDQESGISIWTDFYHEFVHNIDVVKKIRNGLVREMEVSNTRTNGMAGASNAFREMAGLIGALQAIPKEHPNYWEAQYYAHSLEMRRLMYDVFLPHSNSNSFTSDHDKYGEEEGFGWSTEVPDHYLIGTDPLYEGEVSKDLKIVKNGEKKDKNQIEEYMVYKHAKAVRFGVDMLLWLMYEDTDENIVGNSNDPAFGERSGGNFASNKFNENGSDKKHMLSIARSRISEQFELDEDDLEDVMSIVLQLSSIASIGTFTFAEHNATGASPSGATRASRLGRHVYDASLVRDLYAGYKSPSFIPSASFRDFPEDWEWWHHREHRVDTLFKKTGKSKNKRMRTIHHSHSLSRLARNTLSPLRESNYYSTRILRLHDPYDKDKFREVEIFDFAYPHMYLYLFPDRHHRRELKLAFRGYTEGLNNFSKFNEKARSKPPQPKKDGRGAINFSEYRLEIVHSVEDMLNTNISALKSNMMVDWLLVADMMIDYIDRCFIEYGLHTNPEDDSGGLVELKRMFIGMTYECPGIDSAGLIKVKDEYGNYLPHINPKRIAAMRRDFNTWELPVKKDHAVRGESLTDEEKKEIQRNVVFLKSDGSIAFADYIVAALLYESRLFAKNLQEQRVKTKTSQRPRREGHYYGRNRLPARIRYRVRTIGKGSFDRSAGQKMMGQSPAEQKQTPDDQHGHD